MHGLTVAVGDMVFVTVGLTYGVIVGVIVCVQLGVFVAVATGWRMSYERFAAHMVDPLI